MDLKMCPKCDSPLKKIWLTGGMAGEILGQKCTKCHTIFYRGKEVKDE